MNDTEAVEQRELIDGPGTILRRARETKGLDIEAVAAMLHLSEFKINAIEADDFESLPEPVFVRGYLKNYARLLEEPVGPVLDAYSKFGYEPELPKQTLVESNVKVDVNGDHDLVKLLSIVIVAAIIIVPIVIWWDDLGQVVQKLVRNEGVPQPELAIPIPMDKEEDGPTESLDLPIPLDSVDSESTVTSAVAAGSDERIKTTIDLRPAQEPVDSVIQEIEPSTTENRSIPIPLPTATEEDVKPPAAVAPNPVKTAVASQAAKPVDRGVWFNFVDSAWVKVRDAKDRVILIGEHEKGTRKRLTSTMPYKVVLGNSNAVRVEIDGKMVDIEGYSSGGVARFTIADGKIEKP